MVDYIAIDYTHEDCSFKNDSSRTAIRCFGFKCSPGGWCGLANTLFEIQDSMQNTSTISAASFACV